MTQAADTRRILFISDFHAPCQHQDALKFLAYLNDFFKPTLVIGIGDFVDAQALSFFEKNPNLPGALDELEQAKRALAKLYKIFPNAVIVKGNHDYRPERVANKAGLPSIYLKPDKELYHSPDGWSFRRDLMLQLPTGDDLYIAHDVGKGLRKAVSDRAMCVVQGHYHSKMKITYHSNHYSLNWGMNVGCLIDQEHPACNYMRNSSKINTKGRFIVGTGVIINGMPHLIPMHIQNKRWKKSVTEKLLKGMFIRK